jgi:hypothetical protein
VPSVDADATAFIVAAGITNLTQASAINTLVTDLKSAGVWTKMKALYPFVGGTASQHKFNLKDPRDLDAAYRLVFSGDWTHSSTGAKPNGTTGYADTFVANNLMAQNSVSIGVYLGEDNTGAASTSCAIGSYSSGFGTAIYPGTNAAAGNLILNGVSNATPTTQFQSKGFYLISKTPTEAFTNIRGIQTGRTINPTTYKTTSFKLAKAGEYAGDYNSQQQRFTYISDGLSSTEAANLSIAVQTFQYTLGRQVGAPIVSDTDAQTFLNSAIITDQTQANAINTLVTDLKSAGIWTKMKAIYPFVGGTASTHKFNLKDPRDLNAAYRLTFAGGGTHNADGYKGNGTTARAITYLTPSVMGQNDVHMSWRSSTLSTGNKAEIGTLTSINFCGYSFSSTGTTYLTRLNSTAFQSSPATDSVGFYQISRTASANYISQKDATQTTLTAVSTAPSTNNIILMGGPNSTDSSDRNLQLVTLGNGLTTSEMNSLRTIENTYKTNLNR